MLRECEDEIYCRCCSMLSWHARRVKFLLRATGYDTRNLFLRPSMLAVPPLKLKSLASLITICIARRFMAVHCPSRGCAIPKHGAFLNH